MGSRGTHPVGLLVVALCLLFPATATALQRYATPNPVGLADCTQPKPCRIDTALNGAGANDEVILNPGSYGTPAARFGIALTSMMSSSGLHVHGVAGQPRPQLFLSQPLTLQGMNSTLSHVETDFAGAGSEMRLNGGGLMEDFIVHAHDGAALTMWRTSTIRDGVVQSDGGAAVDGTAGSGQVIDATLRNVTAIAAGPASYGVYVAGASNPSTVTAVNTIFRGGKADVAVHGLNGMAAKVVADHDNFRTAEVQVDVAGSTATLNDNGGNQRTLDPRFVNQGAGDLHEAGGSPTIDAGVTDPLNGQFDIDGQARMMGASTDIGADEAPPAACACPAVLVPDRTPPSLSRVSIDSPFAVATARGARTRRRHLRRGTHLRFTLTERATVKVTLDRVAAGRRVRGKCRAPTRRNRRARRCRRYVRAGTLSLAGIAGKNASAFSGRLGRRRKALAPATYRATFKATDAAGNLSKPRTAYFSVRAA